MNLVISALADVPEVFRAEYEERDGKFYLRLSGDPKATHSLVPQADLEEANTSIIEFRDNNRGLHTQVKDLETAAKKFDGIDPAKARKFEKEIQELKEAAKSAPAPDDIEKRLDRAIETATSPLLTKIEALETEECRNPRTAPRQPMLRLLRKPW